MGVLTAEEQQLSRSKILQQTTDTLAMVDALLIWAKGQLEGFKVRPQRVAIPPIVEQVYHLFEPKFKDKNVRLHVDSQLSSLSVFCDEQHMRIIFQNILANAIKYSEVGTTITLMSYSCPLGYVGVAIQNTGAKPPEKVLQDLNEEVKIESSTPGTASERGTGLGLYLVKQLLFQNRGHFNLQCWEKGVVVLLQLPTADLVVEDGALPEEVHKKRLSSWKKWQNV
ncbi:multi-sensor signal transduction histidine kinase [Nitritalea halalkaliphila LW7]|uniref:histidine kinase n=1 Tax=Nitritalea halalkaliphila LW7 TaxID=1189621 RepID=I5C949_9BACT|nr:HAMP domain-containing sensor histidine kinase [Nitritalea halalkaliphila]EIM78351.1 multi-sensor signal transduction histidine kinase [Nitritalea halalkaliphila LW7]